MPEYRPKIVKAIASCPKSENKKPVGSVGAKRTGCRNMPRFSGISDGQIFSPPSRARKLIQIGAMRHFTRNGANSLLKFVASEGQTRRKAAKNRNVCGIHEDFEPLANAALPGAAEFQQTANTPLPPTPTHPTTFLCTWFAYPHRCGAWFRSPDRA